MRPEDRADAEAKACAERGYNVVGRKALNLSDWKYRKDMDDAAFKRLENGLRVRKWRQELYEERGPRYEAWREKDRQRQKTDARRRKNAESRRRRRAKQKAERAKAEVHACEECGAKWCLTPWAHGQCRKRRWCSIACENRFRYRQTKPKPKRTYRCSRCRGEGHTRRTCRG